jgi:hypothetical protein
VDRGLVGDGTGRDGDVHPVVEHDEPERVARVEAVDERLERGAGRGQAVADVHGAAAIEDHLDRRGRSAAGGGARTSSMTVTRSVCSTATRSTSRCAVRCMWEGSPGAGGF